MDTVRSGPFLDEDGCSKYLWFVDAYIPLPISPSLSNPDETQSWIVVDYEDSWFTWLPVRLLKTVESSKNQVQKMFKFMSTCSVTSAIANLDAIDDLSVYLHALVEEVIDHNDGPTVFRLSLRLAVAEDSDDEMDYVPNDESVFRPATEEFIESKLFRFEIEGDDENGDHNGPCSICLEDFHVKYGKLLAKMPCRHVFHDACITKWLNTSGSCPLCKLQVECDEIRDVFDISDLQRLREFSNNNLTSYERFVDEENVFVIWD